MFRTWFRLGISSFGGGPATLALIQRTVVEERRWLTADEFARDWALVHLIPGISQLAIALLVGKRVSGLRGAALALVGLLLPSVAVTIAMTLAYGGVRQSRTVQAAQDLVIPATLGLGVVTGAKMALPLIAGNAAEATSTKAAFALVLGASALVAHLVQPPVLLVLFCAGAAGSVLAIAHAVSKL